MGMLQTCAFSPDAALDHLYLLTNSCCTLPALGHICVGAFGFGCVAELYLP